MSSSTASHRRRILRWTFVGLATLVMLPVLGVAVFALTFDANAWKLRIEAALERATGRNVILAGHIDIEPSLVPAIAVHEVALANAPWGSRPMMATVRRVEVQLALFPLLSQRVEVRRLVLEAPDLLLETNAAGAGNWIFVQPGTTPAAGPADTAEDVSQRLGIVVEEVRIEDGNVAYRNGGAGEIRRLAILEMEAQAPDGDPVAFNGRLAFEALPFTIKGSTGSIEALTGLAQRPWPVRLTAEAEGLLLDADGAVAEPGAPAGRWRFAVQGAAADLSRLAALASSPALPPLRDITFSAEVAESSGPLPAVSDLVLRVGASDLDMVRPGLQLVRLEVIAQQLDQPLQIAGEAALQGTPVALSGTLGPLLALAQARPFLADLTLAASGTTAKAQGQITKPQSLTGVNLALSLRSQDLAMLAPLLGAPLPHLRNLAANARLTERGQGLADGAQISDLSLTSAAGDVAGQISWDLGEGEGLVARLTSQRIDLDALDVPAAAAASTSTPAGSSPASADRVIPAIPLPFAALHHLAADVQWTVAVLVAEEANYRDVRLVASVADGKAHLAPLAAMLPGGRIEVRVQADATQAPPVVKLEAMTSTLDLAPLLQAYRIPTLVTGQIDAQMALRGRGRDTRALAATLDGQIGMASTSASVDPALLDRIPTALREVLLPQSLNGRIKVECFALKLTAEDGVLRSQTLLVDTALGTLRGGGAVNLGDETIALRLVPDITAATVRLRAPVNAGGTLADPSFAVDPAGAATGELEALLSLQKTPDRTLQALSGALAGLLRGAAGAAGAAGSSDCPPQLAGARGDQPAPAPAASTDPEKPAVPPAPAVPQPAIPGLPAELQKPAGDILRGLLGRQQ